ncbi:hypothetical protein [Arthrobacter rhizosphaerae]|uniref:hypothetical protein n=1 Tax=Arthrobacter rhizosphaerae TaxID=2855490 RepID=UPI001FF35F47|nr:hypothetical protein [Arthrobacter rhizosphaerae]
MASVNSPGTATCTSSQYSFSRGSVLDIGDTITFTYSQQVNPAAAVDKRAKGSGVVEDPEDKPAFGTWASIWDFAVG